MNTIAAAKTRRPRSRRRWRFRLTIAGNWDYTPSPKALTFDLARRILGVYTSCEHRSASNDSG